MNEGEQMRKGIAVGLLATAATAAASVAAFAAHGDSSGSTSSQSPYLVPSQDGVETRAIFTVGDPVGGTVDGYRMVGIPDGLGAFKDKGGTFTLLMNHEISSGGAVRAHGANGAFVSQWSIDRDDLSVLAGSDLIRQIATWNKVAGTYNAPAAGVTMSRLCSADLPDQSAFWDKKSKAGYADPLFMNGEETGAEGRSFAHALDGTSYELPALGKFAHENSVANPATGAKTVVVGLDDQSLPTGGQLYVYVGDKKKTGNPADRAGLTRGTLYGIKATGFGAEPAGTGVPSGTAFTGASLGDVTAKTGAELETMSEAVAVTRWQRPEDGAWDPKRPNDFYFVITADFGGNSKLYRLHFNNPANPSAGGTVSQLLTGTETGGTAERFHMLDNIAIDRHGHILVQEDPGGQDYIARVWMYDIEDGDLTEIAHHDPIRFSPASITKLTTDEESSGVIDAEDILGKGWFLLDVQAHYAYTGAAASLVEGGQLLALQIPKDKHGHHDD
jgi:Alkaline phosphatase PhoX